MFSICMLLLTAQHEETYVCRVTAPASGQKGADQDVKETAEDKATEAKEHGKGVLGSISDGFKYAGQRCALEQGGRSRASAIMF